MPAWCGLALAGYAGKALFSTWSTSLSHTATYHTLRRVRQNLLSKLSRVPMGTILDTPSGQYKTTIVDRVEGMEPTLAHLLPEMTSNLLVPVSIAVYIFVLDWRMGLASLVTTVIGFAVASQSGKTYAARWQAPWRWAAVWQMPSWSMWAASRWSKRSASPPGLISGTPMP